MGCEVNWAEQEEKVLFNVDFHSDVLGLYYLLCRCYILKKLNPTFTIHYSASCTEYL